MLNTKQYECCAHDRISYHSPFLNPNDTKEDCLKFMDEQMYEYFSYRDLYTCVRCKSTIAIDRREIEGLNKIIVEQ